MKIAVFGAGAIGGYLGAKLSLAGEDVTLVARGPHLAAMQSDGLRLIEGEGEVVVRPRVAAETREAGPQDYVLLTTKAHGVAPALAAIEPLLGPETAVVTAQNGVPWWYFYALPGPLEGRRVEAVDPDGRIWQAIGPQRAIGCVVYPACDVIAPGVIRHASGDRFSLGEPDGRRSERVTALSRALIGAGLRAPVRTNIRNETWLKLWGNVAFNPLSVLTRACMGDLLSDAATREFARAVMLEVRDVAAALGEEMPLDVEARLDGARALGAHKMSMLRDLELGRPLELDAIVYAVVELARLVGIETPRLAALAGMSRLLAVNLGR